jgi:hypothetical protein
MRITKVTYQKAFVVGPYLQQRVGFEADVDDNEDIAECLSKLRHMAEDWDGKQYIEGGRPWLMPPKTSPSPVHETTTQVIDYKEKENLEIAIDNATSLADLVGIKDECWKHNLSQEYIIKFNELNNGRESDFTTGLE